MSESATPHPWLPTAMTLDTVETHLGIRFPERHRQAFLDVDDPIHDASDFLVLRTPHPGLDIVQENDRLHTQSPNTWPAFLVAFASNGCGDFFAYDLRSTPPSILYIDPDLTVEENLASSDQLRYDNFTAWHTDKIKRHTTRRQGG